MRESKIKFRAVTLKMFFADVVIGSDQATLEQAEERFDRVGMRHCVLNAAALARIFASCMVHDLMAKETAVKVAIVARAIGHKVRILSDLRLQDGLKRLVVNVRNVERT